MLKKTEQKSQIKQKVIKMLSAVMLGALLILGVAGTADIKVFAQSQENEEKDTDGPVVNAAISNEKLKVEAYDESGVKAIYVNDYEFTDIPDGILSIRLQQFDADYEEFVIRAMDNEGNMSEDYVIENPYHSSDEGEKDKAVKELPEDAEPTAKTESKADVKDHTEVKGDDGVKVFYTFETENGKVFYLIIDRTENGETVHFLTDISENDLLNTTSDNSETLPKNSAALASGRPVKEIPKEPEPVVEEETEEIETESETGTETQEEPQKEVNEDKPLGTYIVLGILGLIVAGVYYYYKNYLKKEEFLDEDDDTDEDDEFEELEEIEDDEPDKDDGFFDDKENDE